MIPPLAIASAQDRQLFRRAQLIAIIAVFGFILTPAVAAPSKLALHQYIHTKWTMRDGLPPAGILSIAQTEDGRVWLGTRRGLFRFDGMRFVRFQPTKEGLLDDAVRALVKADRESLWVGTADGLVLVRNGEAVMRHSKAALGGGVSALMVDRSGAVWAAIDHASGRLVRRSPDGRLTLFGARQGLPEALVLSLHEDSGGTVWAGTLVGVCRFTGDVFICSNAGKIEAYAIAGDGGNRVLVADGASRQIVEVGGTAAAALALPPARKSILAKELLGDRSRGLWIGTFGQGLFRLINGKWESFDRMDGLSSDLIEALLEDSAGNIWVGTALGLDCFRIPAVRRLTRIDGLSSDLVSAVLSTRNGVVWAGTAGGGLNRIGKDGIRVFGENDGLPSTTVLSLFEDGQGDLWVGTTGGLVKREGERFSEVRLDGLPFRRTFATTGAGGDLWFIDSERGLWRMRKGRLEAERRIPARDIYQLEMINPGALWLGRFGGGVGRFFDDSLVSYSSAAGLFAGPVLAIAANSGGAVWAAGKGGLSRFDGGRWTTWRTEQGIPEAGVQGLQFDQNGGLWLLTTGGLMYLREPDVAGSGNTAGKLSLRTFGIADEIPFSPLAKMANPAMTRDVNGHIWFRTDDGVAEFDPHELTRPRATGKVVVEQLLADNVELDLGLGPQPFRAKDVRVMYTTIPVRPAEALRYRHRLMGFKEEWSDWGMVPQATYTNLDPGQYEFCAEAISEGDAAPADGCMKFVIAPRFYEMRSFAVLCFALVAVAIWGYQRFKQEQMKAKVRLVFEERTRVARELHDTLLQGFIAILLQMEAASRQIDKAPSVSRGILDRAIAGAERSIREARQAISLLRVTTLSEQSLAAALKEAGIEAVQDTSIEFQLLVQGTACALPDMTRICLYMLGREAIRNAVKHAHPNRVAVTLDFSQSRLRMTVNDDGVGFDLETQNSQSGHFGLLTMKERATQIDARIEITSAPGRGTSISVDLPLPVSHRSSAPLPVS